MSLWNTSNVASVAVQTTSYTLLNTNDVAPFLITAAATATLPSSSGQYAGYIYNVSNRAAGQGVVYIKNSASSTANVTAAAASGDSIFGNSICAPGQILRFESDGAGTWYGSVYGTTAGGVGIQSAVVALSAAQILALNATPVSLIASPGAGKATKVLNIGFKFTAATQYANGGALEFRYTDGSGTKVTADIASAVVTSASGTSYTDVMGIEASLTMVTAAAIVVDNATAPFITGTGTGTFYLLYTTVG